MILVVDSNTGGPSLVAVRMEHLFAYQFDIENIGWKRVRWRKEALFCEFFPAWVLLMSVGESWFGWFYTPVCSYNFHALTVYLYSTFTVPPIGGAFGIQSNICS